MRDSHDVRTGSSQDVLTPYLDACIRKYHKVDAGKKHTMNWSLDGVEGLPEDGKLDLTKLGCGELSMRVRTGRNLKMFPLPGERHTCPLRHAWPLPDRY